MTIPVSLVPTAVANLTTLVQAQVNTDTNASAVLVCVGDEGMNSPDDIVKIAADIRRQTNFEVFVGGYQSGAVKEVFEIDVICSSWSGDDDPTARLARAWVLVGYVETAVRTDPSLSGIELVAEITRSTQPGVQWTTDPVGRLCEVTLTVTCTQLN